MNCYPKRISKQVMQCVTVRLSLRQIEQITELSHQADTKADSYVQEIIETFLEAKRHHDHEPNSIQRQQVQQEVMHSCLEADGFCLYKR